MLLFCFGLFRHSSSSSNMSGSDKGDDDISNMTLDVCAGMMESLDKLKQMGTDNPNVLKILEVGPAFCAWGNCQHIYYLFRLSSVYTVCMSWFCSSRYSMQRLINTSLNESQNDIFGITLPLIGYDEQCLQISIQFNNNFVSLEQCLQIQYSHNFDSAV